MILELTGAANGPCHMLPLSISIFLLLAVLLYVWAHCSWLPAPVISLCKANLMKKRKQKPLTLSHLQL